MEWQPVDPETLSMAEVVGYLRARCPWAAAHTHASLAPYVLEETYELLAAIEAYSTDPSAENRRELIAELGDLAYQVFFHAAVLDAPEATPDAHHPPSGVYVPPAAIDDVLAAVKAKVVRRHPHVFTTTGPVDIAEVEATYEAIKAQERAEKHTQQQAGGEQTAHRQDAQTAPQLRSSFASIPQAMPALARAAAVLGRAERSGLPVQAGLPAAEVPQASQAGDTSGAETARAAAEQTAETVGAELLRLVGRAHAAGIDPESALRAALAQVEDRFVAAETKTRE